MTPRNIPTIAADWRWERDGATEHLIPPGRSIGVGWVHHDVGASRATWDAAGRFGVGGVEECRIAVERACGRPRPRIEYPQGSRRPVHQ